MRMAAKRGIYPFVQYYLSSISGNWLRGSLKLIPKILFHNYRPIRLF